MQRSSYGAPVTNRLYVDCGDVVNSQERLGMNWPQRGVLQVLPDSPFPVPQGGPGRLRSVVPGRGNSPAPCQTAERNEFSVKTSKQHSAVCLAGRVKYTVPAQCWTGATALARPTRCCSSHCCTYERVSRLTPVKQGRE